MNPISMKQFDALKTGDEKFIAQLCYELLPYAKNYCRRVYLQEEDAEETLHDAILIAMANARNGKYCFDGKTKPSTYIVAVFIKLIANLHRKNKVFVPIEDTICLVGTNSSEIILTQKEVLAFVLKDTPQHIRSLFELRYIQGYSDKEIYEQGLTHFTSQNSIRSSCEVYRKKIRIKYPHIIEDIFQ